MSKNLIFKTVVPLSTEALLDLFNDLAKGGQLRTNEEDRQIDERLLTRKEVAAMLRVSLPTLHKWTKNGTINASRIKNSSSIRYKYQDVMDVLQNIQHIKYTRLV